MLQKMIISGERKKLKILFLKPMPCKGFRQEKPLMTASRLFTPTDGEGVNKDCLVADKLVLHCYEIAWMSLRKVISIKFNTN